MSEARHAFGQAKAPSGTSPRVLLVHMPMADPILPNLGIELLCERLRAETVACDVFYGTLRLSPVVSAEVLHGIVGQILYAPLHRDLDVDTFVDEICEVLEQSGTSSSREVSASELHKGIIAAEMNLERCLSDIPVGAYDVIGFSIIFDTQKLPSAALARRLKEREPDVRILFGGTGCDGEMATAVIEAFPEVDMVMTGDADETIGDAVRFATGHGTTVPPNLLTRATLDRPAAPFHVSAAQLEARARPRFDSYVVQRAASIYSRTHDLTLLFEGSRGCWWGDKHHCKFCGIRTVDEGYRQRSVETVLDEIVALHDAHRPYLLYATDAILSREHMRQLMPRLAELRRSGRPNLRLFFEVKSNLARADVALLAAAGVVAAQPGIESFCDSVLNRMDKGATGVRQVAALKWLAAYDIDAIYGLLVGTPGESADDLRELIALTRRVWHLQPPGSVNKLGLHRFSPYFRDPARYGIQNVRPFAVLEAAYGLPRPMLARLCYELDYDTQEKSDPKVVALIEELRGAVAAWTRAYEAGDRMTVSEGPDAANIVYRRGESVSITMLKGEDAVVYRAIATPMTAGRVAEITGVAPAAAERCLVRFEEQGLALKLSGSWLALAVPMNTDAKAENELTRQATPTESAKSGAEATA